MATFIDVSDMVTECRNVSIEGGTYISGKRGEGFFQFPLKILRHYFFILKNIKGSH
jgi:hypothetical protein